MTVGCGSSPCIIGKIDGDTGHHCAYGVLVNKLGLIIPTQQHDLIVKPGDKPLQLDAIDQKYGHRRTGAANLV